MDKPTEYQEAFRANRRRVRGNKGRRLNRLRSERTFGHMLKCASYHMGLLLRKVRVMSKTRNWEKEAAACFLALWAAFLELASMTLMLRAAPPELLAGTVVLLVIATTVT